MGDCVENLYWRVRDTLLSGKEAAIMPASTPPTRNPTNLHPAGESNPGDRGEVYLAGYGWEGRRGPGYREEGLKALIVRPNISRNISHAFTSTLPVRLSSRVLRMLGKSDVGPRRQKRAVRQAARTGVQYSDLFGLTACDRRVLRF